MNPSVETPGVGTTSPKAEHDIDRRVFRTMALAVAVAVLASVAFGDWRVTSGLLLGGLLSLLNHYWLRTSIAAAFNRAFRGGRPRLTMAQYVLRYLVVGITVFVFYKLNVISLVATVAGLCSFVVALFAEALREIYFAIIHREEIT